jgi:YesN/AraC family two-component response regulator
MNRPVHILLADDHTIVRQGLALLLGEQKNLKIVGEAINGQDAVEKALELNPDVIIMDIAMPRMNGIEAAKRIRKQKSSSFLCIPTNTTSTSFSKPVFPGIS